MPTLDIFNNDAFSVTGLTAAINEMPYRPGQIGATGIFQTEGVNTTTIYVESRDGKLSLVEPSERGGPGETVTDGKRTLRPFAVDHFQRDDAVKADEVQNVRAFGTESDLETVQSLVNRKLARHTLDLDMTLEHQRVGAIKGIILSKSGSVRHNLYTEFGIAEPSALSLELDVESTKVGKLIQEGLVYPLEDALDEPYSGIHAFTGRDFHSALWNHKSVMESLLYNAGAVALRQEVPDVFTLFNVTWERYKTGAKATVDLGSPYIAADEARVVPLGVPDLFITRFAPADYEETVNTTGLPRYAKQYQSLNGKVRHLEAQSNHISICTRPGVLRKLTLT